MKLQWLLLISAVGGESLTLIESAGVGQASVETRRALAGPKEVGKTPVGAKALLATSPVGSLAGMWELVGQSRDRHEGTVLKPSKKIGFILSLFKLRAEIDLGY